jgi:hypothetical protein
MDTSTTQAAVAPTLTFTGEEPEPALGGLVVTPTGLTGDPAVIEWTKAVASKGRAW